MTPVRREGYKFCQDICIPCYDTDARANLRPSAFMDFAQEIAYWAASELGFGYDTLHVHHTAWVLTRMHIHFEDPLKWRDNVTLYTWHKGASGLFYLRDFDLRDASGRSRVKATSSWVVIDEQTRRMVRPEDLQSLLDPDMKVDDAIPEPAQKIVLPKGDSRSESGMTVVESGMAENNSGMTGEHTVSYSDLDINGHTNNSRYVVWAMDCLPKEVTDSPVKDLYINFIKETLPSDNVQLTAHRDGSTWFVEGKVGEKTCFLVKACF